MHISFEYVTALEYRLKAAMAKIKAFESGEKYVRMEKEFRTELRAKDRTIQKPAEELSRSHSANITLRNQWFAVLEEMEKEHAKEIKKLMQEIEKLKKRALKAERKLDESLDRITAQRLQIYELGSALEEEKGKNLKLTAQLNRDYENSSIPSSKTIRHKKISNSREKSGRRPGGQPGHKGHCRKKQCPLCPGCPPGLRTKDTAGRSRNLRQNLSCCHRHRKFWRMTGLKKQQKRL